MNEKLTTLDKLALVQSVRSRAAALSALSDDGLSGAKSFFIGLAGCLAASLVALVIAGLHRPELTTVIVSAMAGMQIALLPLVFGLIRRMRAAAILLSSFEETVQRLDRA